jgi:adenylate kinase
MVCDYLEAIHEPGGYVVEFHSPEIFPERWFDLVVLLRCDNTSLFDRLKGRGYDETKITENIECEILEVTADLTKESYFEGIIMELRSDKEEDVEQNLTSVIERLKDWSAKNSQ